MTFYDMVESGIIFQSEIHFSVYDYEKDELIVLTEDEAKHREIKYIYPLHDSALAIEVEDE